MQYVECSVPLQSRQLRRIRLTTQITDQFLRDLNFIMLKLSFCLVKRNGIVNHPVLEMPGELNILYTEETVTRRGTEEYKNCIFYLFP